MLLREPASAKSSVGMSECDIEYPGFDDDPIEPPLPEGLELRPMEPKDLHEVKRLHEQCFPVRYDTAFYENVVRGVIVRGKGQSKEPLYTQVAVAPVGMTCAANCGMSAGQTQGPQTRRRDSSTSSGGGSPADENMGSCDRGRSRCRGGDDSARRNGRVRCGGVEGDSSRGLGDEWDGEGDGGDSGEDHERRNGSVLHAQNASAVGCSEHGGGIVTDLRKEKIVGLITCQVLPLERCLDRDRLRLQRPYGSGGDSHSEVVYILTLGTELAYRRRGVGRALLQRCVWLSRQEPTIGAVYLHVITTNPAAHRFYEAEGFIQVCCISDYYKIKGRMYDCFLYALYVNGAQPPGPEASLGGIARRLFDMIASVGKAVGYLFGDDGDDGYQTSDDEGGEEDAEDDGGESGAEESWRSSSPRDSVKIPLYSAAVSAAAGAGAARDTCIRNAGGCRRGFSERALGVPLRGSMDSVHGDIGSMEGRHCRRRLAGGAELSRPRQGDEWATKERGNGAGRPANLTFASASPQLPLPVRSFEGSFVGVARQGALWNGGESGPVAVGAGMHRTKRDEDDLGMFDVVEFTPVVGVPAAGSGRDMEASGDVFGRSEQNLDEAEQVLTWERDSHARRGL